MQAVDRLAGSGLTIDAEFEHEFEVRLVESSRLAFRVAYSVLRNGADAEEVAQEAFAKAYRSFHHLRDRSRFRPWLVRMTWRLAIDRQRSDRRRAARESGVAADVPAPNAMEDMLARERAARLWRAVDALPEKLRVVVVLANMEGHDISEVAALLRLPEGTVKSRLFSARQLLKDQLR